MSQQNFNSQVLPAFPNLPTETTALHLNNTTVGGAKINSLPASIGDLIGMTVLDLGGGALESIPKEVFQLTNLNLFHVYNNPLKEIPEEIGRLKKLTNFHLANTNITRLPKEIGELTLLTELYLTGNKLEYLPLEIANLKNLIVLDVAGTNLPLPPDYSPNTPANTIKYILENQKIPESELPSPTHPIKSNKAFIFKNISKPNIDNVFTEKISSYQDEFKDGFLFNYINSKEEITKNLNLVFVIVTFDIHQDVSLVFSIIEQCIKKKVQFYILFQNAFIETDPDFMNMEAGDKIAKTRSDLQAKYPQKILMFKDYDNLRNIIFSALKEQTPKIKFSKLHLHNIGHFKNLEIAFDEHITCLVGENGTGKSTILKSLALATIGPNHKRINERDLKQLLRISSLREDGNIIYEPTGSILLDYSIDGDKFTNELKFTSSDEGRIIETEFGIGSNILADKFNLKSLIVGFPQLRGYENLNEETVSENKITQPHINDLIPLINNNQDKRLHSFMGWIVNLDHLASNEEKKEENKNIEIKQRIIIEKVFEIISKITKHDIKFKKVKSANPPEIWVTTYDSPQGIPMHLISQGFKIVMGWVGYYLERMIEAFPISNPDGVLKESATLILDEIDSSIHPKWQAEFLQIIREIFPNTQFIFTTHSPLIVSGLNKEQIIELELNENNDIEALITKLDTWVLNYSEILEELFNTQEPLPKYTVADLEEKLSKVKADNSLERESILTSIDKLKSSIKLKQQATELEKKLQEREKELEQLILKYKEKIQE